MKIGELAARMHTQIETIRYYEREGLLPEHEHNGHVAKRIKALRSLEKRSQCSD
jgi:DNA-binding transcriptional MerR regulator